MGIASAKVTPAADAGPILLTTAVMVTLDPANTLGAEEPLVILRSADAATPIPDSVSGCIPALS
jgi:hypothetical protein